MARRLWETRSILVNNAAPAGRLRITAERARRMKFKVLVGVPSDSQIAREN